MEEELESIIADYYSALGFDIELNSRKSEQVKARAALMTAMSEYKMVSHIGRAFGMNHATVLHHKRKHESNLRFWCGYKEKYEIAKRMCTYTLRFKTIQGKLRRVKMEIKSLQRLESQLNETIKKYEQLQVQNNQHKG